MKRLGLILLAALIAVCWATPGRTGDMKHPSFAGAVHTGDPIIGGLNNTATGTQLSVNGMLNVQAYGAKGDGVTDDSPAISTACRATTGYIVLPGNKGEVYKIASPLVLGDTAAHCHGMIGIGGSGTYNRPKILCSGLGATSDVVTLGSAGAASAIQPWYVSDIYIEASGTCGRDMLVVNGAASAVLRRVVLSQSQRDALSISPTGPGSYVQKLTLDDITIQSAGRNGVLYNLLGAGPGNAYINEVVGDLDIYGWSKNYDSASAIHYLNSTTNGMTVQLINHVYQRLHLDAQWAAGQTHSPHRSFILADVSGPASLYCGACGWENTGSSNGMAGGYGLEGINGGTFDMPWIFDSNASNAGAGIAPGVTNGTDIIKSGDYFRNQAIVFGNTGSITSTGSGAATTVETNGQAGFADNQLVTSSGTNGASLGRMDFVTTAATNKVGAIMTAYLNATCSSCADTTADFEWYTDQGAGLASRMFLGAGLTVGSSNTNDKGAGTINADAGFYANGTQAIDSSNNASFASLTATSVRIPPVALGSCPVCAAGKEGTLCAVNDDNTACAFGATVTGNGGHHVLAYCDGTQYVMTECK